MATFPNKLELMLCGILAPKMVNQSNWVPPARGERSVGQALVEHWSKSRRQCARATVWQNAGYALVKRQGPHNHGD